jgi:hypothetical protein
MQTWSSLQLQFLQIQVLFRKSVISQQSDWTVRLNESSKKNINENNCVYSESILLPDLFDVCIVLFIDWLIDWCLTSSEQFFSYIQDENI